LRTFFCKFLGFRKQIVNFLRNLGEFFLLHFNRVFSLRSRSFTNSLLFGWLCRNHCKLMLYLSTNDATSRGGKKKTNWCYGGPTNCKVGR
jgi:hypothetical protein